MRCKTTQPLIPFILGLSCLFGGLQSAQADIILTDVGVTVTDDFNDFRGDGFAPTPTSGQLDSDTYRAIGFSDGPGSFGGTFDSGAFARGQASGAVSLGGAYAFEVATSDFAVGVQPTDSEFTPGNFTIRVVNQTGTAISAFQLAGDAYFFNDQDRSTRWTFAVSLDDSFYVDIFSLDSQEDADPSPAWSPVAVGGLVPFFTPLANGDRFYIRITGNDLAGTGDRDQFAIDNLAITAVPEPSSLAVLVLMICPLLRVRSRRTLV